METATNVMINEDLMREALQYSQNISTQAELIEIALKELCNAPQVQKHKRIERQNKV
jgi:hypothetical protein